MIKAEEASQIRDLDLNSVALHQGYDWADALGISADVVDRLGPKSQAGGLGVRVNPGAALHRFSDTPRDSSALWALDVVHWP